MFYFLLGLLTAWYLFGAFFSIWAASRCECGENHCDIWQIVYSLTIGGAFGFFNLILLDTQD